MGGLKVWHLMFVGGILGGLIGGVYVALAYVNHPAAFILGMFVGGFVGWGIVSAVLLLFRVYVDRPSTTSTKQHQIPK